MKKIRIIGIGYRGLGQRELRYFEGAKKILGFKKTFELLEDEETYDRFKNKFIKCSSLKEILNAVENEEGEVVVLASGDPLYFGIANTLLRHFSKEVVEVIPDVSSLQLAGALLREPWWEYKTVSFHGRQRDLEELIPELLSNKKLVVLTDNRLTPDKVAAFLLEQDMKEAVDFFVCERLGTDLQKVKDLDLEAAAKETFAYPNLIVLRLKNSHSRKLGFVEEDFSYKRGMITKSEVRAVILHKLELTETGVLWDIGAGSGSVGIEAAKVCPGMRVYAIEKDEEALKTLKVNRKKLGAFNVFPVKAEAPYGLETLPSPDRVFLGGSGGRLLEILNFLNSLKGLKLIVGVAVTLESLNTYLDFFKTNAWDFEVSEVFVTRARGEGLLKGLNPIFVFKARRKR